MKVIIESVCGFHLNFLLQVQDTMLVSIRDIVEKSVEVCIFLGFWLTIFSFVDSFIFHLRTIIHSFLLCVLLVCGWKVLEISLLILFGPPAVVERGLYYRICPGVFLEFNHGARNPYEVVCHRDGFLEKKFFTSNTRPKKVFYNL